MRIALPFFFVLLSFVGITHSGCKSSKESLAKTFAPTAQDAELYLMIRVNKSENGLKVVAAEKKVDPIQHHSRTDNNPPSSGDVFRCSILDSAGKEIRSKEKIVPFQFPGSTKGQDAVVVFFISLPKEGSRAIVYHQTLEGVWKEVFSTPLL